VSYEDLLQANGSPLIAKKVQECDATIAAQSIEACNKIKRILLL
jgi:hypothetical protein